MTYLLRSDTLRDGILYNEVFNNYVLTITKEGVSREGRSIPRISIYSNVNNLFPS